MLYGNALKGVQSGITNVDEDVVGPFATSLYMLNLKYSKKEDIKGDAKVIARGSSGLMEKELKKNDMLEAAQIVASLAQTGRVDQQTIDEAVGRVLESLGLATNGVESALKPITAQQEAQVIDEQIPNLPQGQDPRQLEAEQMAQAQMTA